MERINCYPYLKARELGKVLLPLSPHIGETEATLTEYLGRPAVLLNSGRTAIYLALAARGMSRVDEILVPLYLSRCVLNTINVTAFPVTTESPRTRAILLFHQFGYPQKIQEITSYARGKGWLVVEDCAHSIASRYRGESVGRFGDVTIFSFPKVFPTLLGGWLATEDTKVLEFARAYRASRKGWWRGLLSQLAILAMLMSSGNYSERVRERFKPLVEICYSQFTEFPRLSRLASRLVRRASRELEDSIARRKRNFAIFKQYFLGNGYQEELEEGCEVVPFAAPYFSGEEAMLRVVSRLKEIGVETEILHFDVNRNMLQPDYQKCVPVPVHQGISERVMHRICEQIKGGVKQ